MEDNFLSMDNILSEDQIADLFPETVGKQETSSPEQLEEEVKETNTTEAVQQPESVGSEEITKEKEDTESNEAASSSSNNFYSSIAGALKEEGIFPDLEDEEIDAVVEPEDFRDLVNKQIQAGLEEALRRIYDALNAGVQPDTIKQYESTIGYLNSVTEEALNDESEQGENLRRRLLQQDFMNRGYSQERAVKMTEKLFASGEDIEEAKQALLGNKEYFEGKYNELLNNAKLEHEKEEREQRKQAEQLKKDILSREKAWGDVTLDKATRQKIYDNVAKPSYKDPNTGQYYTALQKYRIENPNDFIKNVGMLFTLTEGFTNLDRLVTPTAKKEVKKKLRELETKLITTNAPGGRLQYVASPDATAPKSLFDGGFSIDV